MTASTSPLLDKCFREKLNPLDFVRYDLRLGWLLVAVPIGLMSDRRGAHMILTIFTNTIRPGDVYDLRPRTVEGEPSWSFAVRPDLVPYLSAAVREAQAERAAARRPENTTG